MKYNRLLLLALIIGVTPLLCGIKSGNAQPTQWPDKWVTLEIDGPSSGCPNHRDIITAYYQLDSEYLFLRLETEEAAGWPGTLGSPSEARYKWWIDTAGGDTYIYGTSVANAEYLIMLEDLTDTSDAQTRDQLGELTFMDDHSHLGFSEKWATPATFPYGYITNSNGSSVWRRVYGSGVAGTGGPQISMSNPDIGYNLTGNKVDMYISLSLIGNPGKLCLLYASDIHNTNLDQAPNCDRPTSSRCIGPVKVTDVMVEKDRVMPIGGVDVGDLVTFKISINNTGQYPLKTIKFEDTYDPSKLFFINSTIPPDHIHIHNDTEAHLHWDNLTGQPPSGIGAQLEPGKLIILNITYQAVNWTSPAGTQNTATVEAEDTYGNHVEAMDSTVTMIMMPPPDIYVEKRLVEPPDGLAEIGDIILFNITVTNDGLTDIIDLNLTDTYDELYLGYNNASTPPSTQNTGSLKWTNLTDGDILGPGESIKVRLNFTALSQTIPDTHNMVSATGRDTQNQSDTATYNASVTIGDAPDELPDVWINKTLVTSLSPVVGDILEYSINITNMGNTTLKHLTIKDTYDPSKLHYVSATHQPDHLHNNTATSSQLIWDNILQAPPDGLNLTLRPGASLSLNLTYKAVNHTGSLGVNNTAEITYAEDMDGNHDNNLPFSVVNTVINPAPPDIWVEKRTPCLCPTITLYEPISFTIQITNTGGQPLTTLNITDTYDPDKLVYLNASTPPTTATPGEITWINITEGTQLLPDETLLLNITFLAINTTTDEAPSDTHNHVQVNASDTTKVTGIDSASLRIAYPPVTPEPYPVGGELAQAPSLMQLLFAQLLRISKLGILVYGVYLISGPSRNQTRSSLQG